MKRILKNSRSIFLAALLLLGGNLFSQATHLDSLLQKIETLKEDTNKVHFLNVVARLYFNRGDNKLALEKGEQSMELAKKLNYKLGLANSYSMMGLAKEQLGFYPDAMKFQLLSLKMFEESGSEKNIAYSYNHIGAIFLMLKNYEEAIRNFELSLAIKRKLNNKKGLVSGYNNIALAYFELKNFDKALENYDLALKYAVELNDEIGISNSYTNRGVLLAETGKLPEAYESYHKSLAMQRKINDKTALSTVLLDLSVLVNKMDRPAESKKLLLEALQVSLESDTKNNIMECYHNLAQREYKDKNHGKAIEYLKIYAGYKDSLLNETNIKKTIQSQMQYDFNKKQAADSIRNVEYLKKEAIRHEQEIEQQQLFTYGGAIGAVLMLLVAAVSFVAFRTKQRSNEIIYLQKKIVEDKQKEIIESINYAKRIQTALIASEKQVDKNLKRLMKLT
jgi:tetratricopeptide (TPR) repeat protein